MIFFYLTARRNIIVLWRFENAEKKSPRAGVPVVDALSPFNERSNQNNENHCSFRSTPSYSSSVFDSEHSGIVFGHDDHDKAEKQH